MHKRCIAAFVCLIIFLTPIALFAEDVFITQQGTKYHTQDCPFIANKQTEKISKDEAVLKGLAPCSKCSGKQQIAKVNNPGKENLVYATANGKKYHKEDCYLIKNKNPQATSLAEAEAKGLTPCSRCFSDETKVE